jgi:hypothetical protein
MVHKNAGKLPTEHLDLEKLRAEFYTPSLTINPKWNSEINQVENGEPITGGALGNANIASRQLGENIFYLKQKVENDLATKANKADVYTKTDTDGKYALKATTISGYNITDAYTKSQIDNLIDSKTGDLTTLKTTDKTQLVKSINEVFDTTKNAVDLLDKTAAHQGLAWYAEHTADARQFPGKHPNIDRLLALENGACSTLYIFPIAK